MKTTLAIALASSAFLALGSAAQADVVVNYPGTYVFAQGGGHAITVDGISGVLTGVRVEFTYKYDGGSSQAYDVAFTVNRHQWGGYYPLINNAEVGETPTGAPSVSDELTFCSGTLGMAYSTPFDNQTALVGFGNGNSGGACTISDVTITLMGVVPTPGAAAALSLGGLTLMRRPRRA